MNYIIFSFRAAIEDFSGSLYDRYMWPTGHSDGISYKSVIDRRGH